MVTLSGIFGSNLAPRRSLRDNYIDWIERQCLANPIDLTLSGTGTEYWGGDDFNNNTNIDDPYKFGANFKNILINKTNPTDIIDLFTGGSNSAFDNSRQFVLDIFCLNFDLLSGIIEGQIPTTCLADKSFTLTPGLNQYERGNARHANTVVNAAYNGLSFTTGGGGWGGGMDANVNMRRNAHMNALTEAQTFLTDQPIINPYWLSAYTGSTENTPPARYPGGEFVDSVDFRGGVDRGGYSMLTGAFGGFAFNAGAVDLASGPGGHIRIFALNRFRCSANGLVRARANQAATRGGGGGTIEIITNNFILEGNVADQLDVRGGGAGTTVSTGGGGGIFVYANSFSYGQNYASFNARNKGHNNPGLLIDENNIVQRSYKPYSSGITRLYKIPLFSTDVSSLQ